MNEQDRKALERFAADSDRGYTPDARAFKALQVLVKIELQRLDRIKSQEELDEFAAKYLTPQGTLKTP